MIVISCPRCHFENRKLFKSSLMLHSILWDVIVLIQISDRHRQFGRSPWGRSRCFRNNEGVKSVNGVVTITNSRYERLELFADLGRDFSLRQPLQNAPEAYPTSRSIDTGPFSPRNKAGGTRSWQLISTWCRAHGWVEVYLYPFLLLARLRSIKRQLISTSSYFFFLIFLFLLVLHLFSLPFILFAISFLVVILLLVCFFRSPIPTHAFIAPYDFSPRRDTFL